jgi:hypothetical protein
MWPLGLLFVNVCAIVDHLLFYSLFYTPLKNLSFIWKRHLRRWRAEKFRPMIHALGLWAGRNHLLWHGVSVFLVLSKGPPHSVAFYDTEWYAEDLFQTGSPFSRLLQHAGGMTRAYSNLDPNGFLFSCLLRHARGCWGPILAKILMGPHSVSFYDMQGDSENAF